MLASLHSYFLDCYWRTLQVLLAPGSEEWLPLITLGLVLLVPFVAIVLTDGQLSGSEALIVRSKRDKRQLRRLRLPDASVVPAQVAVAEEPPSPARRRGSVAHLIQAMSEAAMATRRAVHHNWDSLEVNPLFLEEQAADCRPLLVFVNSRSGAQQGLKVLKQMQECLHSVQVVDLKTEGPEPALHWWSKMKLQFRIVVCGGDGTVGWVLGALEQLELEYKPEVAIIPLGTGNDLARVTGWGGGFTGNSVLPLLFKVDQAHASVLDRWSVSFRESQSSSEAALRRPKFLPKLHLPFEREPKTTVMNNYFGIGVDAAVALDWHQMRESRPDLFVSRLVNKLYYIRSGAKALIQKTCSNIGSKITLECDGQAIDIPENLEGIIVLNIPSFAGGTDLWGQADQEAADLEDELDFDDSPSEPGSVDSHEDYLQSLRQSMSDKKLEVVGVHGVTHLAASQVGLYKAQRLAQASHVKLTVKVTLPVQVDGEPSWFAKDGEIEICHKSQAYMLARSSESSESSLAVATDVVDWALKRQVITAEQRNQMLQEIAHRGEQHTRMIGRIGSFGQLPFG
eukprot:TRINITY_DN33572_c0_g1_i1.p1 TRINITY_DN33572_c0_g1~~TRINITY_DN33572_c0_g1_i1.p1  ORF type:complete len:567 (-),score=130.66 TRINITY_DN33572_c0_g1_i1:32-1732(-)